MWTDESYECLRRAPGGALSLEFVAPQQGDCLNTCGANVMLGSHAKQMPWAAAAQADNWARCPAIAYYIRTVLVPKDPNNGTLLQQAATSTERHRMLAIQDWL